MNFIFCVCLVLSLSGLYEREDGLRREKTCWNLKYKLDHKDEPRTSIVGGGGVCRSQVYMVSSK